MFMVNHHYKAEIPCHRVFSLNQKSPIIMIEDSGRGAEI